MRRRITALTEPFPIWEQSYLLVLGHTEAPDALVSGVWSEWATINTYLAFPNQEATLSGIPLLVIALTHSTNYYYYYYFFFFFLIT